MRWDVNVEQPRYTSVDMIHRGEEDGVSPPVLKEVCEQTLPHSPYGSFIFLSACWSERDRYE